MPDVLITGANRGIGLGLVDAYLTRGARVFAGARRPDLSVELAARTEAHGDRLIPVALDVTDPAQVTAAVERVASITDGLDVVINNAGVYYETASFTAVTAAQLNESLAVNALGPLLVSQQALRLLRNRPGARLVNITMPTRRLSELDRTDGHAYVISRYATNTLTRLIANELAETGIITVALYPGYLRTDMNTDDGARPVADGAPPVVDTIDKLGTADNGHAILPDGTRWTHW